MKTEIGLSPSGDFQDLGWILEPFCWPFGYGSIPSGSRLAPIKIIMFRRKAPKLEVDIHNQPWLTITILYDELLSAFINQS